MKQLFNILLLFASIYSNSQEVEFKTMNDFEIIDFPSDEYLSTLNKVGIDWKVIKKNNQVLFYDEHDIEFDGDSLTFSLDSIKFEREDYIQLIGRHHYLKIKNGGWVIGANKGEWGGSIMWISEDLNSYRQLGRANVNQLFYWKEEIFGVHDKLHITQLFGLNL